MMVSILFIETCQPSPPIVYLPRQSMLAVTPYYVYCYTFRNARASTTCAGYPGKLGTFRDILSSVGVMEKSRGPTHGLMAIRHYKLKVYTLSDLSMMIYLSTGLFTALAVFGSD